MNAYDVLDFLKVNENKKYKSYQIAKVFNVSTATMTMTLNALQGQIESEINGKTRDWWFMSDEVRKQNKIGKMSINLKFCARSNCLKWMRKWRMQWRGVVPTVVVSFTLFLCRPHDTRGVLGNRVSIAYT